jgi:hypothetical protein
LSQPQDELKGLMMPDMRESMRTVNTQSTTSLSAEPPWEQSDRFEFPSESDAPFDVFFKEFMNIKNTDQP